MPTQTLVYALPLPPPFTRNQQPADQHSASQNSNHTNYQYIIQLTIPTSDTTTTSNNASSTNLPFTSSRKRAKASIMIWAGIGRVKQPIAGNNSEPDNAYQRALAEEMGDGDDASVSRSQQVVQFEALSRRLGDDWACAMPSLLQNIPVASSNLLIGIESENTSNMGGSGGATKSGHARSMAERLAKRFHSQIFLSLDIPPALSLLASIGPSISSEGGEGGGGGMGLAPMQGMGLGGGFGLPGLDPLGDKLYLGLEKALVGVLAGVIGAV